MDQPFSDRIYKTISQKVSERTQRGVFRTKSKFESQLATLQQAVKTADPGARREQEQKLKLCEKKMGVSIQRLEMKSENYLEKLGIQSPTNRDGLTTCSSRRPITTTSKLTLLDRPGSRSWTKTASGGKMKCILQDTYAENVDLHRNWDALLGYNGPPFPHRVTSADLATLVPRDTQQYLTQDKYNEFGTNVKPLCRKELPRHAKKATAAQALLYLKLREDKYSKPEAIKHSSTITFKTDSGLHQLKGTTDPFIFNGLNVRVPVSDPENKFKPVTDLEDHKDFDMLSEAYEKFMQKYTVANGEYEPNTVFFHPRLHTNFTSDARPKTLRDYRALVELKRKNYEWNKKNSSFSIKKTPKKTKSEALLFKPVKAVAVDIQPSQMLDMEIERRSPVFETISPVLSSPERTQKKVDISSIEQVVDDIPHFSPAQVDVVLDTVNRIEQTKNSTVIFRCINPKAGEVVQKRNPKRRKTTMIGRDLSTEKARMSPSKIILTDETGRESQRTHIKRSSLIEPSAAQ